MMTPATSSKQKGTLEGRPDGSAKNSKLPAPNFSQPTEMVTFLVGKNEERFNVHKEFACHYSPVLKAAFNSNFIEGQTQTYRLEDMRPSAFRLLAKWFYSERIDLRLDVTATADGGNPNEKNVNADGKKTDEDDQDGYIHSPELEAERVQDLDFAQLWVAGDRLLMPRLQNAVILAWHELWTDHNNNRGCTTSWLNYAYEHTCVESPLRNLVIDQLAYSLEPSDIKRHSDEISREILIDLTLVYSEAVWPIGTEDDDFEEAWAPEYSEKDPGSMAELKYRYRCTRTWRSYLVPEDEE
ncbi:hypothetical protein N431DRAFT_481996 [Stipitochalara longipes BDJ]|nr:hypothetical protein N431DRAFT_481996 [Stipitochalara longipes BDJ]